MPDYHVATKPRQTPAALVFDARNPIGFLAACYERNPDAAWSDATREKALAVLTSRNLLVHRILTGADALTSDRDGALPA